MYRGCARRAGRWMPAMARDVRPEFVRMEADLKFAGRHETERGDDPVFDELYDYAADLRKCLRTICSCDACSTSRAAVDPAYYERMIARYNAALKDARRLLRKRA